MTNSVLDSATRGGASRWIAVPVWLGRMALPGRGGWARVTGADGTWRRLVSALAIASLVALAGCAGGDVVLDKPGAGYVRDIAARVASVDWSKAETVAVTLSEFQFSPARLSFRRNVPYRLRLRNTGARDHTFVSADFFKAIAAGKLVSADGEVARPYLQSIAVPPGAEKELFFVPVRAGTFGLACTVFLHDTFGMEGEITVR